VSTCKWAGSEQPREMPNGDPCRLAHCQSCGHRHVEQKTCPTCIGEARTDLIDIVRLASHLPPEAEEPNRGVKSEAAMLTGAVADVGAWRQRRTYGYRDVTGHDKHGNLVFPDRLGENSPLWVLGTWDLLVTEHYGHKRTKRITLERARDYLAANLSDLAQDPDFPFDDMATDVRKCRSHLENVLHDSRFGDRANVGCFECGGDLERRLIDRKPATKKTPAVLGGFEDVWTCSKCGQRYTYAEYNFALRASLEDAEDGMVEA
jgi:hypothetical protein